MGGMKATLFKFVPSKFLLPPHFRPLFWGLLAGLATPGLLPESVQDWILPFWVLPLWVLPWICLIPVFLHFYHTQESLTFKTAFAPGFFWGLGYFGLYYSWFINLPPLDWVGLNWPMDYLAAFLGWCSGWGWISLFFGLFTALMGLFLQFQKRQKKKTSFKLLPHWLMPFLVLPLLWFALWQVYLASDLGFPWGNWEYTQVQWPFIRSLAQLLQETPLGEYGGGGFWIGVLMLLHNWLWAALLYWQSLYNKDEDSFNRKTIAPKIKRPRSVFQWFASVIRFENWKPVLPTLIVPLLIPFLGPLYQTDPLWPLPVLIIQGNLPIEEIRSGQKAADAAATAYMSPLEQNPPEAGTLVIFPEEGATPGIVDLNHPNKNTAYLFWRQFSQNNHLPLITGLTTQNQVSTYNTLSLLSPNGQAQFHHKQLLVPFGEKTPFIPEQWIQALTQPFHIDYSTPFQAGPEPKILPFPNRQQAIGPMICFELFYPHLAYQYKQQGATLLVNVSNLGWFHGNRMIATQFLKAGQMRAAENALPLAISANTGPTALIDGNGEIIRTLPFSQQGVLRFPD
jgi:apolipoprotein N-acyltransferase